MPFDSDGTYRPLIRPKVYPIRSQSDWPEPEGPMDAKKFAMLRDSEQEKVFCTISTKQLRSLVFDLALELQGRLVAEEQATQHAFDVKQPDPTETLEAMTAGEVAALEARRAELQKEIDNAHEEYFGVDLIAINLEAISNIDRLLAEQDRESTL